MGRYEDFVEKQIHPSDQPIHSGPLAENPMAFEHPVLDWEKYAYHEKTQKPLNL